MTEDNFAAALYAFTHRRPFKPFAVELVSGIQFVVRHPEALTLRGPIAYHVSTTRLQQVFDSESVCQLYSPPPSSEK